jgi:Glycosyltransferase family 87
MQQKTYTFFYHLGKALLTFCKYLYVICFTVAGSSIYLGIYRLGAAGTIFSRPAGLHGGVQAADFTIFYASGLLNLYRIIQRQPVDVYDPSLLTAAADQVMAPYQSLERYILEYPPFLIAFFTPLATGSIERAWTIVFFLSLLLVAIAVILVIYRKNFSFIEFGFCLSSAIFCVPNRYNLLCGQTGAVFACCAAFLFLLLQHEYFFLAGMVSGLCMLKVQYAPALIIVGLCVGRFRYLLGLVFASVVLFAVSILGVGWSNITSFISNILAAESNHCPYGLLAIDRMDNLRGFLVQYSPPEIALNVSLAATICAYGCLAYTWLHLFPLLRKTTRHAFILCSTISLLLTVPFGLHTYNYDYISAFLPCIWFYIYLKEQTEKSWYHILALWFLLLTPMVNWLAYFANPKFHFLFCWAALFLLMVIAIVSRDRQKQSDKDSR